MYLESSSMLLLLDGGSVQSLFVKLQQISAKGRSLWETGSVSAWSGGRGLASCRLHPP